MFQKIELAKSGKSYCRKCYKYIPKGEKRFVKISKYYYLEKIEYYCYNCGLKMIDILDRKRLKID